MRHQHQLGLLVEFERIAIDVHEYRNHLILAGGANDFDDVTFNKPAGYSDTVELSIVAKAQIDAVLQQALAQVRNELLLLRDLQKESRQQVLEALRALEKSGALDRTQSERLQQAE